MNYSFPRPTAAAGVPASAASNSNAPSAPFLKWVGSKRRLLPQLLPLLPPGKRLIEPFLGAGSVFMGSQFEAYLLADSNPVLMTLYAQLQIDPETLVSRAKALFVEANRNTDAYNVLRRQFNDPATPQAERAALFVYLNKFAFNGLYRVNKKGQMNVPYAHHGKLPGFPLPALERFAHKLGQAQLLCGDFEETMAQAQPGDVVYCDPPFLPLDNGRACFTAYDRQGFGVAQQERLATLARELAGQGIPVVISNHDTPAARTLYAGATLHTVHAYRSMSASTAARGRVAELVAVFGG
jgi:DNA adenine methylase